MAKRTLGKALPLVLAALLMLGACDDEEEKKEVVDVQIDKGTELRIKVREEDKSEMIVVGELALFTVFIVWALFGPGATRRFRGSEESDEIRSPSG